MPKYKKQQNKEDWMRGYDDGEHMYFEFGGMPTQDQLETLAECYEYSLEHLKYPFYE